MVVVKVPIVYGWESRRHRIGIDFYGSISNALGCGAAHAITLVAYAAGYASHYANDGYKQSQ